MTINSCRNKTNFAKQTSAENALLYTKGGKNTVCYGHPLTLPLMKNEV
jgi:hypothetical protein